jgi:hypothetical protein
MVTAGDAKAAPGARAPGWQISVAKPSTTYASATAPNNVA